MELLTEKSTRVSKPPQGHKMTNEYGRRGELNKADFGYSLPVDQPLFHPIPVHYKESTILMYSYETDPAAAAAVLPSQLKLTEKPMVRMIFATYKWSSIGFYNEIAQSLVCTYDGKEYVYPVRLHVTSDRAMAAGREIGGFPKKIGRIEFNQGAECLSYMDSPDGQRICSGVMIPGQQITHDTCGNAVLPKSLHYISLRVIPNYVVVPGQPFNPSVCELLATEWKLGPGEMWSGVGSVHLNGTSALDPYHSLPIVNANPSATNPLPCAMYRGDMSISTIEHLETF